MRIYDGGHVMTERTPVIQLVHRLSVQLDILAEIATIVEALFAAALDRAATTPQLASQRCP